MPFHHDEDVGEGLTNIVTVTFPYLNKNHVHVYVDGVEVPAASLVWLSTGTIQLPLPAASYLGKTLLRKRITPNEPLVVFEGGSLDDGDLNLAKLQALYLIEEATVKIDEQRGDLTTIEATLVAHDGRLDGHDTQLAGHTATLADHEGRLVGAEAVATAVVQAEYFAEVSHQYATETAVLAGLVGSQIYDFNDSGSAGNEDWNDV